MIEFYPQIKLVHIACALASVTLFALRGGAMLAGSRLANAAPVRWLSYGIDTSLLTAALMLLAVLHLNPFTTPWLAAKLLALVAYIVCGSLALRHGRTRARRAIWLVLALVLFGYMYGVARMHHPLGHLLLVG